MAGAPSILLVVVLLSHHTLPVATNFTTAVYPAVTTQGGIGTTTPKNNRPLTCALQVPAQVGRCFLCCAGAVFNGMALTVVSKNPELNKPFRIVLSSLTIADLGLALTSVLIGTVAIFDGSAHAFEMTRGTWQAVRESPALSTICNILTGVYHSLLGCSATTTLAMSVDRLIAVFAPVRYRFLGLTGNRISAITLPPWILASLCTVLLPVSWWFYGDTVPVVRKAMSCWPYVAVRKEFLIFQSVVLIMAVVGVTSAHAIVLHRLSRRAILVVPMFGPRNADNTEKERRQTRRSATHAASQALGFCILYLTFAVYLLVLATAVRDRPAEACEARFLLLSLLPTVNIIINPMLTLWRLQKCPGCRKRSSGSSAISTSQALPSTTNGVETICHRPKPTPTSLAQERSCAKSKEPELASSNPEGCDTGETSFWRKSSAGRRISEEEEDDADDATTVDRQPRTSNETTASGRHCSQDTFISEGCRANPDLLNPRLSQDKETL